MAERYGEFEQVNGAVVNAALDALEAKRKELFYEREHIPDDIRSKGWAVAAHNDYRLEGEEYTFWLFTKNGRAVKGEGLSDAQALNQVRGQLSLSGAPDDG